MTTLQVFHNGPNSVYEQNRERENIRRSKDITCDLAIMFTVPYITKNSDKETADKKLKKFSAANISECWYEARGLTVNSFNRKSNEGNGKIYRQNRKRCRLIESTNRRCYGQRVNCARDNEKSTRVEK